IPADARCMNNINAPKTELAKHDGFQVGRGKFSGILAVWKLVYHVLSPGR
ncbi:MAG: hypothetical protein GYA24_07510, partial [Candidatus Lokiarchaeota archaeon]|nr:hypothetical protein [Candidatus Lokiarchaeota archaeon]